MRRDRVYSILNTRYSFFSSMKAPSPQLTTPLVSRSLKTVGLIMIVAAILDILILLTPFQAANRPWLINAADQIANRGIVPLTGIVLLFTGYWVDSVAGVPTQPHKSWQDLRFWASLLASLLGIIFLLLAFLHPNNVRLNYAQQLQQIGEESTQFQAQETNRLTASLGQQRTLLDRLIAANDDQLNQAVQGGVITQEQVGQIRQFKQNPDSLAPFLKQREDELRNQIQTQVGLRREQAQKAARLASLKSGLSTGLSSLLLAIGFSIVGWSGLRSLGEIGGRRSS